MKHVIICTEDKVATMNPEDLLENGQPASMLLAGEPAGPSKQAVLAARNLASVLIGTSPIVLAELLEKFSDEGGCPPNVGNTMVELLNRKVMEATPDEINMLVVEAKKRHVWQWIKPTVLARNVELAAHVLTITNIEALDVYLHQVATSSAGDPWLPGPIFDAAAVLLSGIVVEADIGLLDRISELAWKWRIKPKISTALRARMQVLANSIAEYDTGNGYIMKLDTKSLLVEKPQRALRLQQRGYEFVR